MTVGAYYVDGKAVAKDYDDIDFSFAGVSARYNYSLSERTALYVGAGYGQTKVDGEEGGSDYKAQVSQVYCGLTHTFLIHQILREPNLLT